MEILTNNHAAVVKLLLNRQHNHWYGFNIQEAAEIAANLGSREALIEAYPLATYGYEMKARRRTARNRWDNILQKMMRASFHFEVEDCEESALLGAVEGGHISTCQLIVTPSAQPEMVFRPSGAIEILEGSLYLRRRVAIWRCWSFCFEMGSKFVVPKYLFIIAAMEGHATMLAYSITKGYHKSHLSQKTFQLYTFIAAVACNQSDTVELLAEHLDLDLDTAIVHRDGTIAPLLVAVDAGSVDMVRLLIKLGASPDKSGFRSRFHCARPQDLA
jgi:hypothetical protein